MKSDKLGGIIMQTNHLDDEEIKTFRNIYKDLESVYDEFPKICGLSGTEYWALSMIHEGIVTQHGICEQLSISRQTVNSAFKQLKKRGLIELKVKDDNLRVKQIYLTEAGQEFIEREITNIHQLEEKVWHDLEAEERKTLTKLLYKYKVLLADALNDYKENIE